MLYINSNSSAKKKNENRPFYIANHLFFSYEHKGNILKNTLIAIEVTLSEYHLILPNTTLENLFFRHLSKIYVLEAYGKRGYSQRSALKKESKFIWGNMFPKKKKGYFLNGESI